MAQEEEFEVSLDRPAGDGSLRILEVIGVLLAVVPCGVLAGLYLVSEDITFLIACAFFAAIAVVVVFWRRPTTGRGRRRAHSMREANESLRSKGSHDESGDGRFARILGLGAALQGKLTKRAMKVAGFFAWMAVWIFTAVLFTRVAENENVISLAIFVMIGSLSPLIFYYLLETGVDRLGNRLRDEE
jgi:Flp pilus assembly protein TadB